jgi:hypothetical protein
MRATALLLMSVLTLTACGDGSRTLAGDYRLRRGYSQPTVGRIDTVYSLWDTARPENEAGWDGAVLRIGWDARKIVVLRGPPSSPYGAAERWMVIDADRGTRSLVLTEAQLRRRTGAAHVPTFGADSAWARL